ncbi:MAG: zf-HC2 domain-containing protein [Acidobacteriota bacterium]|nr:zf-HC2 domain-containing protein [Blastocatellia bacterium]MDW8413442.1 zf-HC2 domain-containing protein [Acidobacteriota bacterium]
MKCSECQEMLSEFIDDELIPDKRREVSAHLAVCANCEIVYNDLSQIVLASRNLPELAVRTELWDELHNKLQTKSRLRTLVQAAWTYRLNLAVGLPHVACLLLIVGGFGWSLLSSLEQPKKPVPVTKPVLLKVMQPEEAEVCNSIDRLMHTLQRRKDRWDPSLQHSFQRSLLIVDQAIQETKQLFERNPDDRIAYEMMMLSYKEKVRLLEQFSDF